MIEGILQCADQGIRVKPALYKMRGVLEMSMNTLKNILLYR